MRSPQKENGYVAIANELMEALARTRINGEARQVLDFILRKTYGYNKKSDHISYSQISKGTGLIRCNAIRGIKTLTNMNMIHSIKGDTIKGNIYSINKHYNNWNGSINTDTVVSKPIKGSIKTDKKVVSKRIHTKDSITKDSIQKTVKTMTPQAEIVQGFKILYEQKTNTPFKADKKDYIIISNLINKYSNNTVIDKIKILAIMCEHKASWFCRSGWADFKIGTLSNQWNSIIPEGVRNKEIDKKTEFDNEMKKRRAEREQIN